MPIKVLSYRELYSVIRGMDLKEPTTEQLKSLKSLMELKASQIEKEIALRSRKK